MLPRPWNSEHHLDSSPTIAL